MSLRNDTDRERDREARQACLKNWPDAVAGEYNPSCCRFPKSCSCPPSDEELMRAPQPGEPLFDRAVFAIFSGRFDHLTGRELREMVEGRLAVPCEHGAANWSSCVYCSEGAPR